MQVKLRTFLFLLAGLVAAIYSDIGSHLISSAAAKSSAEVAPGTPEVDLLTQAQAIFGKLPTSMPGSEHDTPAMVALGKQLYFEKGISINKTQSCNSCHPLDNKGAGADNLKTGKGAEGKFGNRNDPSTMNAGFQIAQFWDGRAATLEDQAKGPPLNPIEMGMANGEAVAKRLKEISHYPADFVKAFPGQKDPVTYDNFAKAVAAFERTLISRGRLDRYIDGDKQALTDQEMQGMRTFIQIGCVQCHNGPNLGGTTYQKLGVFHAYSNREDIGRFKVTKLESDKYVFKTASLRNVTLTAPYFHDGEVSNLAEAVDRMAYMQLDKKLSDKEINNILRFLTTLADEKLTTTPSMQVNALPTAWVPPLMQDIPRGETGDLVRYGALLLTDTYAQLGPDVKNKKMRFSGSTLNCTSCHLDSGTKQFGLPWMGVSQAYPQYRGREDQVQGLEQRINGCFERSLSGKELPVDSREMKAMVAYIGWLSKDMPKKVAGLGMPKKVAGLGMPKYEAPTRKADVNNGEQAYGQFCMSCHGKNGNGYQSMSAGSSGSHVVPVLWGASSYNNGAGMNRLLTTAAFIQGNMPLGTTWNHPAITNEDAYDIAGYLSSMKRPQMSGLEKDYPKLEKKPADAPYPPYADNLSQERHQYGPFLAKKETPK